MSSHKFTHQTEVLFHLLYGQYGFLMQFLEYYCANQTQLRNCKHDVYQ